MLGKEADRTRENEKRFCESEIERERVVAYEMFVSNQTGKHTSAES